MSKSQTKSKSELSLEARVNALEARQREIIRLLGNAGCIGDATIDETYRAEFKPLSDWAEGWD